MEIPDFIALVNTLGDAIVAGQDPYRKCEVFNSDLANGLRGHGLPATFCRVKNYIIPTHSGDPLFSHAVCVARPNKDTWSAIDLSSGAIPEMPPISMWFGDSLSGLATQVNMDLPGFGSAMLSVGEAGFRASFAQNGVPDV